MSFAFLNAWALKQKFLRVLKGGFHFQSGSLSLISDILKFPECKNGSERSNATWKVLGRAWTWLVLAHNTVPNFRKIFYYLRILPQIQTLKTWRKALGNGGLSYHSSFHNPQFYLHNSTTDRNDSSASTEVNKKSNSRQYSWSWGTIS